MKQARVLRHRRRRHFIDAKIQGHLIWSLILLEVVLFAIGMVVIYLDMQSMLDDRLYRVHELSLNRPLLLQGLWKNLPWIIGINILLILYVDAHWKKRVRPIVMELQDILCKVKRLDLRHRVVNNQEHDVLASASDWLKIERERYSAILALCNELPTSLAKNNQAGLLQLQQQLTTLQATISNRS